MSDVIDFNELKNRASDKDLDKFEQYIYELYYSMAQGQLNMMEFSKSLREYMEKNNISEEKLMNIQKKFMERYGLDVSDLENQMKSFGIDMSNMGLGNLNKDYEDIRKTVSFHEKYKDRISLGQVTLYKINNDLNTLDIILQEEKVILKSQKNINLKDNELNEFLCSYKKLIKEKNLKISLCENVSEYDY
ncbi:MAG: DUF3867 domain-containing protein [Clostridium argentinense]|uniref:DUF3867 domain-containing protein n=1 Tax=Clostridium faecium TaxID=2762223 RepID=A0ABR8YWK2_9CLOT|nr:MULTISPECIES: DUF3867 domain-containing protein [Clostridium]MBD8048631.1 DUF3867 domain-containing protein [Clostridium faecium]MBS5822662.1 DUF3867 domain-containing protein [Clostridium argentinense]MDU1347773.1 DUF3867 domain-containing protein [Clostridium argentinense]